MTKTQIVSHFADQFEIPKKITKEFFEELATLAAKETKKVGAFTIPGIGKLTKAQRKARTGRNPKTGEAVELSGKHVPHFKPGKELRERVNNVTEIQPHS